MRALLDADGPDPATADGLHARYWPPPLRWVRANVVASVDGAATLGGKSGGLGGEADHRVFEVLRDHADVVLVGAGTVRDEGYGPLDPSPRRRSRRVADGRSEVPRLAVVGRPSSLRGDERWITGATAPPLLVTTTAEARDVAGCETVAAGDGTVDLAAALGELARRGLRSVLCEGGPRLLASVAGAGLLDELCLTYSPTLAGPGAGRIVHGDDWQSAKPLRLVGLLEDEGLLLARYAL
jgi:riboflavin biosynthesis pyrimidine reductase